MKNILLSLLIIAGLYLPAQNLANPSQLGQTTRNQKVGNGFQVEDTLLSKGVVRFSAINDDGYLLSVDDSGYVSGIDPTAFGGVDSIKLINGYILRLYGGGDSTSLDINIIQKSGYTLGIGVDEGGQDVAVISRVNADNSITLFKLDTTTANIGMISPGGNITALQTEVGRASISSDDGSNTSTIIVLPTSTSINTDSFLLDVPGSGSSLGIGANNEVYRFSGSSGWSLTGNASISGSEYIGSSDASDFSVRHNAIIRAYFEANGTLYGKHTVPNVRRHFTIIDDTTLGATADTIFSVWGKNSGGPTPLFTVAHGTRSSGTDYVFNNTFGSGASRVFFNNYYAASNAGSYIETAAASGSFSTLISFNIYNGTLTTALNCGGFPLNYPSLIKVGADIAYSGTATNYISFRGQGTASTSTLDAGVMHLLDLSAGVATFHFYNEGGVIVSAGAELGTQSNHDAVLTANGIEIFRLLAGKTAVKFVPTTEPTSPAEGWCYWDDTANKLRCYDGSVWNDLW